LAKAGLVASNGEGKRAILAKAVSVNDAPVTDETATLTDADIVNGAVKLSFGRKKHALLKVE
jgi:tyrosyl-tRNA synthetase